ncbi:uracil-DNA glycosylase [Microbaculum marinisediminis]|uniref:Type-4 uracil-DNA glycosylase n=1 Tax=Microbaculum marinisediminis TaxID=2931392 RepID=A0AAW5QUS7_9HYPH|nr:uracil-DNA glycosylase family protein [Microbaculum sp. A6E488]MCT8970306.1 uracil-DNA glycosylase [Microbaculum sp. A6E488]
MSEREKLNDEASRAAARSLLAWQAEAGADEAIGNHPVNRMAAKEPGPGESAANPSGAGDPGPDAGARGQSAPAGATAARTEVAAPDPVMAARTKAREARTLVDLLHILEGFEGCPLRFTAKNLCFADGNPEARVMFIGEAPGADEDIQGKPFVGRAGKLLDKMLAAIGLDRSSAYITNVVYWRPPGNRTPTPQETQICRPFIERQIELADPDFVVFLGGAAAKEMLNRSEGILKLRGKWFDFDTGKRTIKAIATLHPAYLLRQPAQKRLAWRDFLAIKKALDT